jgi:uncharacterized protein YceK
MHTRYSGSLWLTVLIGLSVMSLGGCASVAQDAQTVAPNLEWLAFRVRSDTTVALNADTGWAAPENSAAEIQYDQPFRFRIQVRVVCNGMGCTP